MSEATPAAASDHPLDLLQDAPRRWLPGGRIALAVALAAGIAHALAFAPANLPWLELLALAALFCLALAEERPRAAALLGFAFGAGWFGVGISWIYISLSAYGGLWPPLAALSTAALAGALALFPALALQSATARTSPGSLQRAVALMAAWTLSEWLRGIVFTGLPWISTGYAHTDGMLAGYAPVIGVYGVGAIAASIAAAAGWGALHYQRKARIAGSLAFVILAFGAGAAMRNHEWTQDFGRPIRVRLVQGNIAQDIKFAEGGLDEAIARYLPALRVRGAAGAASDGNVPLPDLIVLPESAFPVPVSDLPDAVLAAIGDSDARAGAALIFGAFIVEPQERYFNSAIGLSSARIEPQRYSKRHLVPFGEYVPTGFHWFMQLLRIPIGDQEAGDPYQPPMQLAGQRIAVNICFEDLFGALILDSWHDPALSPTILLNLSNLAWFNDSIALPQHLQISRMRALETGRPLVRATNTGITAFIDARGHVTARLPTLRQALIERTVQGKSGDTPFIRTGNSPILIVCALLLAGSAVRVRALLKT
jgi:apolipoprotein N-acyltransferase